MDIISDGHVSTIENSKMDFQCLGIEKSDFYGAVSIQLSYLFAPLEVTEQKHNIVESLIINLSFDGYTLGVLYQRVNWFKLILDTFASGCKFRTLYTKFLNQRVSQPITSSIMKGRI